MTRDEALVHWQKLWHDQVWNLANDRDEHSYWYVNGYICWLKNGISDPLFFDLPAKVKEWWYQGNQDARGDWPKKA